MSTQSEPSSTSIDSSNDTSTQPSNRLKSDVLSMHQQGEPDEVIALAFTLPLAQVRDIVNQQLRAVTDKDDPAPIVRRVPRKSRHPDRCPHCGAMLTIKPCLFCYFSTWTG